MRKIYIADDGVKFDTLEECEKYEAVFLDKKKKCATCFGDGEVYESEDHDCWGVSRTTYTLCFACGGTGEHDDERHKQFTEYKRLKHLLGIKK